MRSTFIIYFHTVNRGLFTHPVPEGRRPDIRAIISGCDVYLCRRYLCPHSVPINSRGRSTRYGSQSLNQPRSDISSEPDEASCFALILGRIVRPCFGIDRISDAAACKHASSLHGRWICQGSYACSLSRMFLLCGCLRSHCRPWLPRSSFAFTDFQASLFVFCLCQFNALYFTNMQTRSLLQAP